MKLDTRTHKYTHMAHGENKGKLERMVGSIEREGTLYFFFVFRTLYFIFCIFIGIVVFICLRVSVNLVSKLQGKPGTTTVKYDFNPNRLKFHWGSP